MVSVHIKSLTVQNKIDKNNLMIADAVSLILLISVYSNEKGLKDKK